MSPGRRQTARRVLEEIRLLGELQLVREGEAVTLPASRKTRALLGYLVATGVSHRRECLCELLWEGPNDPRAELRWSLSKIRSLVNDGDALRLRSDRQRVIFEPAGAEVDLPAVRNQLSNLSKATTETISAALARFRGNFLDGLDLPPCYRFQEWRRAEDDRVRALRLAALSTLVERLNDRPAEALSHARALLAADPLSEEAHARVIWLLGRLGRGQEALAQYELARDILQRELGAPPSSTLERARCAIGTNTAASRSISASSRSTPEAAGGVASRVAGSEPARAAKAKAMRPAHDVRGIRAAGPAAASLGWRRWRGWSACVGPFRSASTSALVGIGLILAGVGGVTFAYLRDDDPPPAPIEQKAGSLRHQPSIVVLPFGSIDDEDQAVMSRGLTDSLTGALSRNPFLLVIAPGSASTYSGQPGAAQRAAKDLGVRYVLEGTVRQSSDGIRVATRLVDSNGGRILWAGRYERPIGDLLALEEEITAEIARALHVRIVRGTDQASGGTQNLKAWAAFVRGKSEYARHSRAGNSASREHFLQALELDPDYAEAMIALAHADLNRLVDTPREQWADVLVGIEELKRRAAAIAPNMPSLLELRSLLALTRGDHQLALAHAELMTEFDPGGSDSHYALGRIRGFTGQYESAIESLKKAERLNPHHRATYASHRAFAHLALGEAEAAVPILEEVVDRWPDYRGGTAYLAIAYQLAGRSEEAHRQVRRLPQIVPDITLHMLELRFSPMLDREAAARFVEAARQAGIPE